MISAHDRRDAVQLINEAVTSGARLFMACQEVGVCHRTYRRWQDGAGDVKADARPQAVRKLPANALSEAERPSSTVNGASY